MRLTIWQRIDDGLTGRILKLDKTRLIGIALSNLALAVFHGQGRCAFGVGACGNALGQQAALRRGDVTFQRVGPQRHRRAVAKNLRRISGTFPKVGLEFFPDPVGQIHRGSIDRLRTAPQLFCAQGIGRKAVACENSIQRHAVLTQQADHTAPARFSPAQRGGAAPFAQGAEHQITDRRAVLRSGITGPARPVGQRPFCRIAIIDLIENIDGRLNACFGCHDGLRSCQLNGLSPRGSWGFRV